MLTSIALIFLIGILLGGLFNKIKLPSLIGMIITGMILSPYALHLLDDKLLSISAEIRQIALVIILTRAGLALNISDLKKVGRPALFMSFLPATIEIVAIVLIAPILFGVTILEAALMGSVLAAVSPAVVVPRMITLIENKRGTKKGIPQLIVAGASVDDVYVIVLFTAFTALAVGSSISTISFLQIPISIILGIGLGILVGKFFTNLFKKVQVRDSIKLLIIISVSFLLLEFEQQVSSIVSISALLSIMSMGVTIKHEYPALAIRLSIKYNKLWVAAEVMLFVLVGATVNTAYMINAGIGTIAIVLIGLLARMFGVWLSLLKTPFIKKERLFCMVAYTPKATVQAAIGSIPLTMGLACGELVLSVAVLSILITAPFGAKGIDCLYTRCLSQDADDETVD